MATTTESILMPLDIFIQLIHQCFRVLHIADIGLLLPGLL